MKTYLIKKEIRSLWKWVTLAIIFHFITFSIYVTIGTYHHFFEAPYLLLTGNFRGIASPFFEEMSYFIYFTIILLLSGVVFAIAQIRSEIQDKTLQFLLHRPILKKDIIKVKLITGIVAIFISNGIPLSFIAFTCSIEGNFPAPFTADMFFYRAAYLFLSAFIYLGIFQSYLINGKWKKMIVILQIPLIWGIAFYLYLFFLLWFGEAYALLVGVICLLAVVFVWHLVILNLFEEMDFK
jgi:ABC-type transport system involved in multi-copper enzyme maturation permease subunit